MVVMMMMTMVVVIMMKMVMIKIKNKKEFFPHFIEHVARTLDSRGRVRSFALKTIKISIPKFFCQVFGF